MNFRVSVAGVLWRHERLSTLAASRGGIQLLSMFYHVLDDCLVAYQGLQFSVKMRIDLQ
jgi:hypothetical protein